MSLQGGGVGRSNGLSAWKSLGIGGEGIKSGQYRTEQGHVGGRKSLDSAGVCFMSKGGGIGGKE